MGILEILASIEARINAGTSGTSHVPADVPLQPLQDKGSTSGTSGTSGTSENVERQTATTAPIPPAMLEDLAERAAIIAESLPDTPDAQLQAERDAVRLVQCRACAHFTPDGINPLAGLGACAVQAWPQSSGLPNANGRSVGVPPWPMAQRYCRARESAT